MEEKFEDEQDMQERARTLRNQISRGHERSASDSEVALQELIRLAKQHGNLYPIMIDILKGYGQIFQRDIEL
jgi:diaphanous 1